MSNYFVRLFLLIIVVLFGCGESTENNSASIVFLVESGKLDRALAAISKSKDLNVANRFGVTPLIAASGPTYPVGEPEAIRRGYETQELEFAAIVEQLILGGADVRAKDENGLTALHRAARNNRLGTAYILLSNGATFSATKDHLPMEVLIAAKECYPTMTVLLAQAASREFDRDSIFRAISEDVNVCESVKMVNQRSAWQTFPFTGASLLD